MDHKTGAGQPTKREDPHTEDLLAARLSVRIVPRQAVPNLAFTELGEFGLGPGKLSMDKCQCFPCPLIAGAPAELFVRLVSEIQKRDRERPQAEASGLVSP